MVAACRFRWEYPAVFILLVSNPVVFLCIWDHLSTRLIGEFLACFTVTCLLLMLVFCIYVLSLLVIVYFLSMLWHTLSIRRVTTYAYWRVTAVEVMLCLVPFVGWNTPVYMLLGIATLVLRLGGWHSADWCQVVISVVCIFILYIYIYIFIYIYICIYIYTYIYIYICMYLKGPWAAHGPMGPHGPPNVQRRWRLICVGAVVHVRNMLYMVGYRTIYFAHMI